MLNTRKVGDARRGFEISVREAGLLVVRMWGFWDEAVWSQYLPAVRSSLLVSHTNAAMIDMRAATSQHADARAFILEAWRSIERYLSWVLHRAGDEPSH